MHADTNSPPAPGGSPPRARLSLISYRLDDRRSSILSDHSLDLVASPLDAALPPPPAHPHSPRPSPPPSATATSPTIPTTPSSSFTTIFSLRREGPSGDAAPIDSPGLSSTFPVSSERNESANPSIPVIKGPSSTSHAPYPHPSLHDDDEDEDGEYISFVPRDLDKYPRGQTPRLPFPAETANGSLIHNDDRDSYHLYPFTNGSGSLHSRLVSEPSVPLVGSPPVKHQRANTMAVHPSQNRPPSLKIRSNNRRISASSTDGKPVKAPGRKISSFFGWRTASPTGSDSSSTDLFDADYPRLSSPLPSMPHSPMSTKPTTTPIDVSKANGIFHPSLGAQLSSSSSQTPGYSTRINELEKELRDVSSELASSIRREMELEDLVDRLQSEMPSDDYPRTSDYFSDSGASSIRYSSSRIEELEKTRRAAEQERARLKVELSQRLQEEISQRTASESHVHILEAQVQQLRRERVDLSDLASKNRELEIALEDTRRKLAEERQVKDNFEDLLTAVRVEIEQLRNERDHLRDVVVPQLQSQNNTMAPASDHFEIDQLLGEIAALKVENASLAQLQGGSLARMPSKKATSLAHSGSLSRSNSVAKRDRESRESLAERVKDIEEQRDALHQTLKSLLFRHAYEAREHERRVKALELELEHATQPGSRGKLGYEREVYNLRDEINRLRQRAEDALVQKWQCEKGLAGLKMDLDRAEQQTTSLRMLLQEHDIDVPEEITASREVLAEVQATSSSLEFAYEELQADRQYAEAKFSESPDEYSAELMASVDRTQNLSNYVRQQLKANESLRGRLAHAIGQGEEEQQISASRINELQNRLKELEDQLLAAQQHSEEEVAKHEDEVNRLKETHHRQILRLKNGSRTPVLLSPQLPNSPFFARSPRLDRTTSGDGIPLNEAVQTENLERMVKELEKALRNADLEMEEVISRMNRAQIDVAELQSDRDDALRQTRKLQAEILAERQAFKALMG